MQCLYIVFTRTQPFVKGDSVFLAWISAVALGAQCAGAGFPPVPGTNEVAAYERERPVFRSKAIRRELGDVLLTALVGGQQLREWRSGVSTGGSLPAPARHWLTLTLTNGAAYRVGLSAQGDWPSTGVGVPRRGPGNA
jgi:hypothetical protein